MSEPDGKQSVGARVTETRPRRLNRIESLLIERGVVDHEALAAAKARQRGAKRPLVEVLLEQDAIQEDRLVEVLAEATGLEVIDENDLQPVPEIQDLVPAEVAQRLGLLPLHIDGDELVVATGDPLQIPALDELARRTKLRVRPLLAKPSAVRRAMRQARGGEEVLHDLVKNALPSDDLVVVESKPVEGEAAALPLDTTSTDAPTVKMVNLILSDAITRGASDVHIEAEKEALRVRFRLDGQLQDVLTLPANVTSSILARIKIISGLDIIETRAPQDGRAKVACQSREYDLRVSTLPTFFGEKAVIRVLDATAPTFHLDRSGLDPELLAAWRELIHRPDGLLLLTGPTGSGKTSTLYASLLEVRTPTLNIVTVEDPVEYQFPGIVHVPVRHDQGMTFATALRSILRQDPDVVLIGEIRDSETAEIAVQAALTGHLVLSTVHTRNALGAIPRLIDLGVEMEQLTSCLAGVMAQRLARTICSNCAEPCEHPPELWNMLGADLARHDTSQARRGRGCRVCRGSGFRGRIAIAELLTMSTGLRKLLRSGAGAAQLGVQLRRDGMRPLLESGLRKATAGTCTPEEVLRVADTSEKENKEWIAAAAEIAVVDKAAPAPEASTCESCGAARESHWRLCPLCGAPLTKSDDHSVLVCDDERVARRQAARALEGSFPAVLEADSGETALDLIARQRPDLLVVDMMMPGMSGIDVIRALRSDLETASLPIIMLTASEEADLEERSLVAGADDYLCKPVEPERLRVRALALVRSRSRIAVEAS